MADILIKPANSIVGTRDDFVGMKFVSGDDGTPSVEAIFPLGYHYTGIGTTAEHIDAKKNQAALKKELYALLRVITRYDKNYNDGELDGTTLHSEEEKFPFYDYIAVVTDFMQYGYYIESEIKYKCAPTGKINWKRTIAQVKPTIQKERYPVYTDFIIRQNLKKTDNLISLIHEWCVYEAFTKFGWLFTPFNPQKPALEIGNDKKERAGFVSVILDALKSTFNDRNRMLFNAMIAMLRDGWVERKSCFSYGTTHFHTVWEGLIDTSYGIPETEKRKFFPEAKWRFVFADDKPISANNIRPDTIMRLGGNGSDVFVLDAKYYSFITDKKNVPSASDINKQVAYGAYAAHKVSLESASALVYNAFLIPYNFKLDPHKLRPSREDYSYIGYASMDGKSEEKYERVLGILIDTKWLMQNAGRIDNKKGLAEFVERNSVYRSHAGIGMIGKR
jgi:hypothetical protein